MKLILLVLLSFFPSILLAVEDFDKQQIQERIGPVGKVRVEKEIGSDAAPTSNATKSADQGPPGKATYEQYCIVCHRDGLAGAPKFEDQNDWKPRLEGKSIDEIVAIVKKGLNAMPEKGTCVDCTDEDLKAAILYMKPKS